MQTSAPRILLVEDNVQYIRVYEMALSDMLGATIGAATDGEQALAKLRTEKFDLVLLDLNIPKLSGEALLAEIRRDPQFDNMPVVILTGDSSLDTQSRLLSAGADDFIEKGSPPDLLLARIRAQLRHRLTLERVTEMALDMDIFTAGVLHDIRNIDSSIVSLVHLIRMQMEEDPVKNKPQIMDDLDKMMEQSERISQYATHVIQRVKESHNEPTKNLVKFEETIDWVRGMLKEGLAVVIPEPLRPVMADQYFLRLAILNILQNSVKYTRPGQPPQTTVTQRPGGTNAAGAEFVVTRFRDNGIGIPADQMRDIFKPFVRGVTREAKKVMGFGLGLALVSRAINKMNGKVWAEAPDDGQGTGSVICIALQSG